MTLNMLKHVTFCELQEIFKKVRSIVNKLTPQKFQTLVQQVLDLEINSEVQLKGVIDIIYESAVKETKFSVAYANLCKCMVNVSVILRSYWSQFLYIIHVISPELFPRNRKHGVPRWYVN